MASDNTFWMKLAGGLLFALWWASGPNLNEEMEFSAAAKAEKRQDYNRHYAFKGRGRKMMVIDDNEGASTEILTFTRAGVE